MLTGTNLSDGISADEAAQSDAFAQALGYEVEQEQEEQEQEEEFEEELETEEDFEEDSDEQEAEEHEEAEEEESEEQEEEQEEDTEFYVVTIDGEEYEVSEDELLSGYKRTQDFQREKQELEAKRTQYEKLTEEISKQRNAYSTFLEEELEKESKKLEQFNDIDWNTLRKEDPNQFLLKQYEMNEVRQAIQDKRAKFDKAQEEAGNTRSTRDAELIAREQARVEKLVDGWGGDEHDKIVNRLQTQATTEGFTDDDNDLLKHAQVIKLLDKAAKYDELVAKKDTVVKKKVARQVPKVIRPGNKQQIADGQRATATKKQFNKLKQTGSLKDSVPLFEQFL